MRKDLVHSPTVRGWHLGLRNRRILPTLESTCEDRLSLHLSLGIVERTDPVAYFFLAATAFLGRPRFGFGHMA